MKKREFSICAVSMARNGNKYNKEIGTLSFIENEIGEKIYLNLYMFPDTVFNVKEKDFNQD